MSPEVIEKIIRNNRPFKAAAQIAAMITKLEEEVESYKSAISNLKIGKVVVQNKEGKVIGLQG